jgi:aminocarboxymuconate-semialdehyde decarboxylase
MLVHSCGHRQSSAESASGSGAMTVAGRKRPLTIDAHCHILVPEVERLVAGRSEKTAESAAQVEAIGSRSFEHNAKVMLPAAGPKLTTLEARLRDMEQMGVDVQIVSPTSVQHYYWADVDLAREIVRVTNEHIAAACEKHPDRLVGLGNIALQHSELSIEQLTHCVEQLGLRGVEISSTVNGRELDDPLFERFWAKAEELGCVVFLHPFGTSLGSRVNRFYLSNIIGQPIETTIALSHLIFGGVLDRYPGLKILAAHGGGYLPSYIGRSNHGYAVRPESADMRRAPGEYLKQLYFDTLVYEPESLRHLIEQVGASQLVVGTDYPFDMGMYQIHALLDSVPNLTEEDKAAILGGNAAKLFSIAKRA